MADARISLSHASSSAVRPRAHVFILAATSAIAAGSPCVASAAHPSGAAAAHFSAAPPTAPAAVRPTASPAIAPVAVAAAAPPPSASPSALSASGDIAAGKRVFSRCASCHQIGGTAGAFFGPQLTVIVGRPAAATRDFAYSPAMKASRLVWTEQNLAAFIRDPKKVVPGTSMRFWGLSDQRQIADLIAYLRSVK